MKSPIRVIVSLCFAIGLAACATMEPASRGTIDPIPTRGIEGQTVALAPSAGYAVQEPYRIAGVTIEVPRDLRVSEANLIFPIADIVWRGEPRGNRYIQVENIFNEAFASGTADMTSGRPVLVNLQITRFHCLTEITRETIGGSHSLRFILTVRDAATGEIIDGPRQVHGDTKGSGGALAIAEENAGLTQRIVVVTRLSDVLHYELSHPVGTDPASETFLARNGKITNTNAI